MQQYTLIKTMASYYVASHKSREVRYEIHNGSHSAN